MANMGSWDRWEDAERIEGFAGEVRVNLVRVAAIAAFYLHHVLTVILFRDDPSYTAEYHEAVTMLVVGWLAVAGSLYVCLWRRFVPAWLKYASTLLDVVLITALVVLHKGPQSPLVVLYFLVVAAAALRLSKRLVYAATLGSLAGYLFLIGYATYCRPQWRVERTEQAIVALGLGVAGLLAGQVVRQARRLVAGYPVEIIKGK